MTVIKLPQSSNIQDAGDIKVNLSFIIEIVSTITAFIIKLKGK